MAKFILSAFADEASGKLDEQIEVLKKADISLIELRDVDGVSCADLTIEKTKLIKNKLDENGIRLSALGSPFGKIGINDPFEDHAECLKRSFEICNILGCDKIRMFSFFYPQNEDAKKYKEEVYRRLEIMLKLADDAGIRLCHENEKDIYGDIALRAHELHEYFGDRMGVIFDPANYIQCGVDPLEAYKLQKDTITYFHMKDALKIDGSVVPVGKGDGSIPEILSDVNKSTNEEIILTIEPHLYMFDGLSNLQADALYNVKSYKDPKTAFFAACDALKEVLKGLED